MSDIKTEVGYAANIQSCLGLIAPFEVQRLILRLKAVRRAR